MKGKQFTKSLMTDNLSPAGIDAFINQLYTTGPTSPVVCFPFCPVNPLPSPPPI